MADNENLNYEPVTSEPNSEIGKELYALLGNQVEISEPESEIGKILYAMLGYEVDIPEPKSVIARLLYQYYEQGGGGGNYQDKTLTPNFSNGNVTVLPDEGYDALSSVVIEKDADLIAANIKKNVNLFGVTGSYEGANLDSIIDGSITSVDSNVSVIREYAFYKCISLISGSFPSATSIGGSAFNGCTSLSNISIPNATSLPNNVFLNCTSLISESFPNATSIGSSAFEGCTSLTEVSLPNASGTVGSNAFKGCTSLTEVSLPSINGVSSNTFSDCTSLTILDFPAIGSISGSEVFKNCEKLNILILRSSNKICSLSNINAFSGTPFASDGAGGTLYVPQTLISSYQAAARWSTILGYPNNQIKAIEGSIYE